MSRREAYRGNPALLRFRLAALRHFRRCQWCNRRLTARTATVDHLRPQSLAGTDEPANLCLSCAACNNRRDSLWRPGLRPRYGPADWSEVLGERGVT